MTRFLTLLTLIALAGCNERQPATNSPPVLKEIPAPTRVRPDDLQPTYPEPTYTVAIEKSETDPPTYAAVWTAAVNTGGWKMTTDTVLIEDPLGRKVARIYIILHEPQPGDVVTQAAETLTGRHDAGTTVLEGAELSAKHTVRDSNPTYK